MARREGAYCDLKSRSLFEEPNLEADRLAKGPLASLSASIKPAAAKALAVLGPIRSIAEGGELVERYSSAGLSVKLALLSRVLNGIPFNLSAPLSRLGRPYIRVVEALVDEGEDESISHTLEEGGDDVWRERRGREPAPGGISLAGGARRVIA